MAAELVDLEGPALALRAVCSDDVALRALCRLEPFFVAAFRRPSGMSHITSKISQVSEVDCSALQVRVFGLLKGRSLFQCLLRPRALQDEFTILSAAPRLCPEFPCAPSRLPLARPLAPLLPQPASSL